MKRTARNIALPDPNFDNMHHALGRPFHDEIHGETYRNYFAAGPDSETAERMAASPHWTDGNIGGSCVFFHVTEQGKAALSEYIAENVETPNRYTVTHKYGGGENIVTAKSHSAAKYAAYLYTDSDMTFKDFLKIVKSVRLYSRGNKIKMGEK